jgi:hypothetical protein
MQNTLEIKLPHWILLAIIAIFLGAMVHILSFKILKVYRIIGLYKSTFNIYKESDHLSPIKKTIEQNVRIKFGKSETDSINEKEFGLFYDIVYYKLEAMDKIETARSFQSFYFFFRNFFLTSLIAIIILMAYSIICALPPFFWELLCAIVFMLLVSWYAAIWYRVKMTEKMLWAYYSNKD